MGEAVLFSLSKAMAEMEEMVKKEPRIILSNWHMAKIDSSITHKLGDSMEFLAPIIHVKGIHVGLAFVELILIVINA